jgi:hypothetical protein
VALRTASLALPPASFLLVASCGTLPLLCPPRLMTSSAWTRLEDRGRLVPGFRRFRLWTTRGCERSLQRSRLRRGEPGRLFVKYEGVPPGEKLLRLRWDYDNDPTRYQDVRLGEGSRAGTTPLASISRSHRARVYPPVTSPVTLSESRAQYRGKSGNCGRNRSVTLEPAPRLLPKTRASGRTARARHLRRALLRLGDGTVRDNFTGLCMVRTRDASV